MQLHFSLLQVAGLEPARDCSRGILSPLRLPIPPHLRTLCQIACYSRKRGHTRTKRLCFAFVLLGTVPTDLINTLLGGGGFEPPKQFAADLQSVPFGHSGIRPFVSFNRLYIYTTLHPKAQVLFNIIKTI